MLPQCCQNVSPFPAGASADDLDQDALDFDAALVKGPRRMALGFDRGKRDFIAAAGISFQSAFAVVDQVMGDLWEIIQRRWKARRYKGENGETVLSPLVFFRKKGRGIPKGGVPVTEFRKTWKAACEAGDKPEALFHDFRRTAVRNMIRAGVSWRVAMLISGHKTESVFERYNITDEHDLEDAVRRTQEFVARHPKKRQKVTKFDAAKMKIGRSK